MVVGKVFTRKYPKHVKRVLIGVAVATSALLVAVFVSYRSPDDSPVERMLPFLGEGGIALNRVHQESTRNGVLEWRLDADSIQYTNETKQAILKAPSITFFLENKDRVLLKAEQGRLDTDSKDIAVTDHVTMNFARFSLETDTLHYEHKNRRITSTTPVKISGDRIRIRADTMVFDLHTNRTVFKGNIKGTLSGTI
ncbi:MAG: LPS export ABC transporter periplasmic protein LptC [Desulfobacterales bacterium]